MNKESLVECIYFKRHETDSFPLRIFEEMSKFREMYVHRKNGVLYYPKHLVTIGRNQ